MTIKNTKRSGGPKTTAGKLVASQNSLKTGTYSSVAVLPHEDQEEFNLLVDQFNRDFAPKDVIEITLVRELAVITWKKLRLEKLEQGYFLKKLNAPILQEDFEDSGLKFTDERFKFWVIGEWKIASLVIDYQERLALMKPHLDRPLPLADLLTIQQQSPYIYQSLMEGFRTVQLDATEDPTHQVLLDKMLTISEHANKYLTIFIFELLVGKYESELWCIKNEDRINDAVAQIKQERLLKLMQSDDGRRANDDLSRSLIRTLSEFRKQNLWRNNKNPFVY